MFNPQGAYQHMPWQQIFNQAAQRTGPPPAKKPKNNPVITRYPPPPGYRGPAQPQVPPYQQPTAWQTPAPQYGYSQPSYPAYPQHGYGQTQSYQPPQFSAYQTHPQFPQAPYSAQGYPHQPLVHSQSFPTPQTPTVWPQSAHGGSTTSWHFPDPAQQQRRHFSAPSLTGWSGPTGMADGSGDGSTAEAQADDDLEDDFYAECYFATHPEEIDPKLSLGMIEWKAPLPTKRPLPSTFAEAELEALAPRKPLPTDDESISDYFIKSKRHEAFLSVRQTEYWQEVKDDIIFKEFPVRCSSILTMSALSAKYKDRPDSTWAARVYSPTPDPEQELSNDAHDIAMDVDSSITKDDYRGEQSDMLGSLEQAIQQNGTTHSRRHSRASSVASISSQKMTRPAPLMPIRDQAQEDILAALGVTGSPKVVYQTPGPALGAPLQKQQSRDGATSRGSRHNSTASNSGGLPVPPPTVRGRQPTRNGYDIDRRGSDASQHTAMGSDFEDNDATPRPKHNGTANRKRGYEDSEDETAEYNRRWDNDETPKQRRKQPRVDDPYTARRW